MSLPRMRSRYVLDKFSMHSRCILDAFSKQAKIERPAPNNSIVRSSQPIKIHRIWRNLLAMQMANLFAAVAFTLALIIRLRGSRGWSSRGRKRSGVIYGGVVAAPGSL